MTGSRSTRTFIAGIAIAAVFAVIVTVALSWRPHRATTPAPVAPILAAPSAPPTEPIPPPPVVERSVGVPPTPTTPTPMETTGESVAAPQRPDLMREERNQAKAVDLFADKTLQLEEKFSDDPDADEAPETRALHQFMDREEDTNAADSEREIGDRLREWMAAFPTDVADRLVLVSVECRIGGCRVLLAELSIDLVHQATALGATALDALFAQPWWRQDFISQDVTTQTLPDQPGAPVGHALLTIYASRTPTTE